MQVQHRMSHILLFTSQHRFVKYFNSCIMRDGRRLRNIDHLFDCEKRHPMPRPRTPATPDVPASDRIQFSISMSQATRAKVETLAGLRHMSISDYVNLVMESHLASISDSTWEQIRKAEAALSGEGIKFKKRE